MPVSPECEGDEGDEYDDEEVPDAKRRKVAEEEYIKYSLRQEPRRLK